MKGFLFRKIPSVVGMLVLALGASFVGILYTQGKIIELESRQAETLKTMNEQKQTLEKLGITLETLVLQNTELLENLENEKDKNGSLDKQVRTIKKTVGTLEKLSQTDPELLQKYSKVYFLNENYIPIRLSDIDQEYLYNKESTLQIHSSVAPYLRKMLDAAREENLDLEVISAYRSFGTQAALKSSYRVQYGTTKANQFSADQGYSEHQLGTTLDLTTPSVGATFTSFEQTPEYAWLLENAHRFGFTLSYPKGNAYYQYEPWHWRFVGVDLATKLYKDKKYFYDLDQRQIDTYLVSLFD